MTTDDRMTGAELRARREYLGITSDLLAARLINPSTGRPNRPDTVRRWESGRERIPVGVTAQIARVERETDEQVEDLVFTLTHAARERMADGWQAQVLDDRRQPVIRAYGARWWRHVVVRAAAQVPGSDIAGLLVWPAHWLDAPADE